MIFDRLDVAPSAWPWRIEPMTANDEPAAPDRAERFEIHSFEGLTVAVTDNIADACVIAAAPALASAAKTCLTLWRDLYEGSCDAKGDTAEIASFEALDHALGGLDHQTLQHRSPEQVLEAAMCVWEHIDQVSSQAGGAETALGRLRADIGSPSMRYYAGLIAARVSEAYAIAENGAGGYYDEPFDWHFVPAFLDRAIMVAGGRFTLCDDWRRHARALGCELGRRSAPDPDTSGNVAPQTDKAARSVCSRLRKASAAIMRLLDLAQR